MHRSCHHPWLRVAFRSCLQQAHQRPHQRLSVAHTRRLFRPPHRITRQQLPVTPLSCLPWSTFQLPYRWMRRLPIVLGGCVDDSKSIGPILIQSSWSSLRSANQQGICTRCQTRYKIDTAPNNNLVECSNSLSAHDAISESLMASYAEVSSQSTSSEIALVT